MLVIRLVDAPKGYLQFLKLLRWCSSVTDTGIYRKKSFESNLWPSEKYFRCCTTELLETRGRLSRLSLSMGTNFLYTSRIGISTCDAIAHKWFKWRRSMLILVICFCVVFLLSLCLFFHDSNMIRQNLIKKARRLNQNTPISQWERAF